jgi:hypothetical protein
VGDQVAFEAGLVVEDEVLDRLGGPEPSGPHPQTGRRRRRGRRLAVQHRGTRYAPRALGPGGPLLFQSAVSDQRKRTEVDAPKPLRLYTNL